MVSRIHPKESKVKPSEIRFYSEFLPKLSGKRVLLVTNPSGIGKNPEKIKSEFKRNNVKITHLLGLEHGFLGLEEDFSNLPVTIDTTFNLPIYHIYKLKKSELFTLLTEVNAVVFDVQDVGMRSYTYLTVLKRIMDAISKKTELILLDHISPGIEQKPRGDVVYAGYENFAGEFPLLLFTGLTFGESALYYNKEFMKQSVKLSLIPVENFNREMSYDHTGYAWHTPSPNLPHVDTVRNYFSLVLLEGVNVSVGRGTQAPFHYFGAPWLTGAEYLAEELNSESKDYYFTPVFFKPVFGPYKGLICRGLRLYVVNQKYDPVKLGYELIAKLKKRYSRQFQWTSWGKIHSIDHLWGSDSFRKAVNNKLGFSDFHKSYEDKEKTFSEKIKKYYIY